MRLFSRPTPKLPITALPPEAAGVVTTRRIEITVEREWSQAVVRTQEDAAPGAPTDNTQEAERAGRLR